MKKKLIAIVTSLAMVATMVPATAFAGSSGSVSEPTKSVQKAGTKAVASFADLDAVKAALNGTYGTTTDSAICYTADTLANYKALETAIGTTNLATDGEYNGTYKAKHDVFKATLTKLNTYYSAAKTAAEKAIEANTVVVNASADLDASGISDITGAATAVTGIGATSSTCKIPENVAVSDIVNAAYADSTVNAAKTADSNRYSNYQKAKTLADAITLLDAASTTVNNTSTADDAKEATDAYDALSETLKGKLATALTTKVATLKTNYNTYMTGVKTGLINTFKTAMTPLGTTSTITNYSKAMDDAIKDVCDDYMAMMDAITSADIDKDAELKSKVAQFESLVDSEWSVRLAELEDAIKPLNGAITPTKADITRDDNTLDAVTKLSGLVTLFYTTNIDLYTVLTGQSTVGGDVPDPIEYLGKSAMKATADRTKDKADDAVAVANKVKAATLAIGKIDAVTDENYDNATNNAKITAAQTAYDAITALADPAMTKAQLQARVGNYSKLTTAKATKERLDKEVTDAKALMEKVAADAVPVDSKNVAEVTATCNKAESAYYGLAEGQRDDARLAGLLTRLEAQQTEIEAYQKGAAKETAAQELIDALPANPAAADATQIALAKAAYDALTGGANGVQANVLAGNLTNAVTKVQKVLYPNGTSATADAAAVTAAVKPVQDLIEALPANVTAAEKQAVLDANEAYTELIKLQGTDNALENAFTNAQFQKLKAAVQQAEALDKADRDAVQKFLTAVNAINSGTITKGDTVNAAYEAATLKARSAYDTLTEAQKKMVEEDTVVGAKDAYDNLLIAEANVEAAGKMAAAAKLIMAVPNAATLDVNDADAVKKVKDAQAAYEALTPGVQTTLRSTYADAYANYEEALEKVTNAETATAAKAVIDAISALEKLPTAFESKEAIDAVKAPLEAAEKAYKALTDTQKAAVTNYTALSTYRTNYDALLSAYVDDIYAKAAKIDVTAELTDEDIAVASELKAYVEDKYIETKNIAGFKQDVYDALMEALNKILDDQNALENATIAAIEAVTYDGTAKEPAVTVTDKAGKTIADTEYNVRYSNNVNAGTATVIVSAKSGSTYTGSITADFTIDQADINAAAAVSKIADKTYTKKAITPAVTVKAGDKTLANGTDYTVSYAKNTNIGQAAVTIKGTGNYKGTITTSFIIKPAKGKVTKLTAGKKQITVSYETQKAQSGKTGYRIICKTTGVKATGINTTAAGKTTVKKLKSGKTYQVKVRAYKTIGGTKYYGSYSTVKKVKVK